MSQQPKQQPPSARLENSSWVKTLSIKTLRATIGLLEGIVQKLEAPTTEKPASPNSLSRLWAQIARIWQNLLRFVRSLLPQSVNQKLPDWGLTGAIATISILLFWTTTSLLQPKPPQVAIQPPEVVQTPAPEETTSPIPEETIPPTVNTPPIPEETTPPIEKIPTISTPQELTAPLAPQAVEIAPPPPPILTPEQNLIASIQNQVSEITNQYANGLIQSIQANFAGSLLSVKVSDAWYNLKESQQDKLANEMLARSQALDFSKLEITDLQGKIIARSPLVGNNIIILQRRSLTANS